MMRKNLLPIISLGVFFLMLFLVFNTEEKTLGESFDLQSTHTHQSSPYGYARKASEVEFNPKFIQLSAEERYLLPTIDYLTYPMGSENGAFSYVAQNFWANNPLRGGYHTGADLNGIGGENTDLGDSVFSCGDGYVAYAGIPSPSWGKTIILCHKLTNGQVFQTRYSHLQSINVNFEEVVYRGQNIGSVGSANGQYLAHLHFEVHLGDSLYIGPGYLKTPANQVDPISFLKEHAPPSYAETSPSSFQALQSSWEDLQFQNAETLLKILQPETNKK